MTILRQALLIGVPLGFAGEPKTLWAIPEAKHVGGLAARPAEYERRVIGFFDDALLL